MSQACRREELESAYRELHAGLLGYLRRRLPDGATAEDLLQSVFLRALASQRTLRSSERLSAWLHSIARNALIDYYRARRATEELPADLAAEVEDGNSDHTLAACLEPLALELPDSYREVLIASEFRGEKLADIARRMKLSLSAVKSRVSRGRRMLRARLLDCCHVELSASGAVADYRLRNPGRRAGSRKAQSAGCC